MNTPLALAALVALVQAPDFQLVHNASESEPILFVHVDSQGPQLEVGVYSRTRRLAVWQDGTVSPGPSARLDPGQHYVYSQRRDIIGVVELVYPCLAGTGISRIAEWTRLRLPGGLPQLVPPGLPPLPPQPGPGPVLEVAGASTIDLGPAGRLAVALEAKLHPDQPGRARLFRRLEASSSEFTATGEFPFESRGELQASADGSLLTHQEGRTVRVIDFRGTERARIEFGGRVFLSEDARWIALVSERRVEFRRLDAEGQPSGTAAVFSATGTPTNVQFLGDRALILDGSRAPLVDAGTGQALWSRQISEGGYCSSDLLEPSPGRLLIALGSLDVLSPPRRDKGKHAPGAAVAVSEVFELATDESLARSTSTIRRWTYDQPRVRIAGAPARLITLTADEVRITAPLP